MATTNPNCAWILYLAFNESVTYLNQIQEEKKENDIIKKKGQSLAPITNRRIIFVSIMCNAHDSLNPNL